MKIINLLHFYQPHNQQKDILDRIVNESYRPMIKGLKEINRGKIVANITGGLITILMENGYSDIIEDIKDIMEEGRLEITGTAMYHALLPLLPEEEIERQINANEVVCQEYFGDLYTPKGFFSPEMAINDKVMSEIKRHNFQWIAAPSVAYGTVPANPDRFYKDKNTGITVFFRNKNLSSIILSGAVRSVDELVSETKDLIQGSEYWFTVMDAETFGHHRIGHEKFLFQLWESEKFENMTVSELMEEYEEKLPVEEVVLRPSTWTNEEQDFWLDKEQTQATSTRSYILWKDPENPIHKIQWELTELIINAVNNYPNKRAAEWKEARERLDKAVASDQYWWASAKPWWSLEMIEQGAYSLMKVLEPIDVEKDIQDKAQSFYRAILDRAFEWQRSGYIRKRHLENSGTFMKEAFKDRTPPEWFNQVVLEFEYDMEEAARNHNYEKAIKWRDALEKMKLGIDMHDVLHVVDDFWLGRNVPWNATQVKPFLQHEWEEFSDFAKNHFLCVSNRDEFEEWKTTGEPPKKE